MRRQAVHNEQLLQFLDLHRGERYARIRSQLYARLGRRRRERRARSRSRRWRRSGHGRCRLFGRLLGTLVGRLILPRERDRRADRTASIRGNAKGLASRCATEPCPRPLTDPGPTCSDGGPEESDPSESLPLPSSELRVALCSVDDGGKAPEDLPFSSWRRAIQSDRTISVRAIVRTTSALQWS